MIFCHRIPNNYQTSTIAVRGYNRAKGAVNGTTRGQEGVFVSEVEIVAIDTGYNKSTSKCCLSVMQLIVLLADVAWRM